MKRKSAIIWLAFAVAITCVFAGISIPPAAFSSQAQEITAPTQTGRGQVVNSGVRESRQGTKEAQRLTRSEFRKTPPDQPPPPKKPKRAIDHVRLDAPVDPSVRPEDIRPTNPPIEVNLRPPVNSASAEEPSPLAPNDFTFFRNTGLASAPVVGPSPAPRTLNRLIPIEPSAAVNGRVAFYTTNSYAAVSGDRGQTFTYIDPFDLDSDGADDPVNGGFGGDQYVYHERTRGLTFWLIQYSPDNATNRQRLLVARSQDDVLNGNWFFYDFAPADFGFTTPNAGASGFWFDFPDMAVSDNFLYLTTNVFNRVLPNPTNPCAGTCPTQTCPAGCTSCTNTCSSLGAVSWRIPLDQLALGGGVNFGFYTDTRSTFRLTHGARATMYWGAHNSTTQIRIYRWADNSNNVAFDDVNHAAYNNPPACTTGPVTCACGSMLAASPDGNNFACATDTRILGAYVANGVIGFMWNAAQGGGFAFPHVQWLRFNEGNRTLINQVQIFNPNHAFLYPSVHPNDRGHLGGTMAWGGGIFFPNALAWIADDVNAGAAVPFDNLTFAQGNAAPNYNRWGDYFATRIALPQGNTWMGTGFVVNGAGGVTRDPHFVLFGRERDTPPATNTIYVDRNNNTGIEDGSAARPYNTVFEGHTATQPGDTLIIRAGTYPETIRFNKGITVRNENGVVRIQP